MTPKGFAALAIVAVVSFAAAVIVYTSSVEWSRATQSGAPLFADLRGKANEIAKIEIERGGERITLARDGGKWTLSEHDSYPAAAEKVNALVAGLSAAQLVEAKTRREDRYDLLAVEDPNTKDAKSRLVRLLDGQGNVAAAVIVGRHRVDESGLASGGTYIRKPDDPQAWLTDANLDAGIELRDWVNPYLFEARPADVISLEVTVPGKDPVKIKRDSERPGHTLDSVPEGMKLKYMNIVDEVVRAASTLDFSDVRKANAQPDREPAGSFVMELEGGLKITVTMREEGGDTWLTLEASGGEKTAEPAKALMERAQGWEFRIPEGRVKEILKSREDLLEPVSS